MPIALTDPPEMQDVEDFEPTGEIEWVDPAPDTDEAGLHGTDVNRTGADPDPASDGEPEAGFGPRPGRRGSPGVRSPSRPAPDLSASGGDAAGSTGRRREEADRTGRPSRLLGGLGPATAP